MTTPARLTALRGFLALVKRVHGAHPEWPTALGPVTAAQWALESRWGERSMGVANNPFGIKARPGEPFVEARTWEDTNGPAPGGEVRLPQKFRRFASLTEAIEHHGKLLTNPRYAALWKGFERDPHSFARAIAKRYATDPAYAKKLIDLLDRFILPAWGVN